MLMSCFTEDGSGKGCMVLDADAGSAAGGYDSRCLHPRVREGLRRHVRPPQEAVTVGVWH